jgi:periplasmic protein TonB
MKAAHTAQAKAGASNVVQLRDWQPAHSRAKPRAARVPVVAAFAVSVIAHAALLYLLRAPAMPPATLPLPIEVVLVQPPVPLPLATPPPQPAPPERKRAQPKAQPRAPARAARERVQPPPLAVPREERSTFVAPAVPVAPPAPPEPSAAPAPVARAEPSAPAIAPAPQALRPAPVSPPSFNAAYLRNPPPRYPLIARRNGEQGTVTLRVLVTRDGAPGSVVLEKTSGWPSLDAAALATVKEWRFVPAQQNGQPVDAPVLVPIVFRLQDAS